MDNCNSGDNVTGSLIHTDVTTRYTCEPQHMYRLGTVSKRLIDF